MTMARRIRRQKKVSKQESVRGFRAIKFRVSGSKFRVQMKSGTNWIDRSRVFDNIQDAENALGQARILSRRKFRLVPIKDEDD
jgi:hypothetical protein